MIFYTVISTNEEEKPLKVNNEDGASAGYGSWRRHSGSESCHLSCRYHSNSADHRKLKRYNLVCVTIMEDIDFATTHYEKIRFDSNFKAFERAYPIFLAEYKLAMKQLLVMGRSRRIFFYLPYIKNYTIILLPDPYCWIICITLCPVRMN